MNIYLYDMNMSGLTKIKVNNNAEDLNKNNYLLKIKINYYFTTFKLTT